MKIIETRPREKGFVLWDHCQNLLDDPRNSNFDWIFIKLAHKQDNNKFSDKFEFCPDRTIHFRVTCHLCVEQSVPEIIK